jgi:hypothetical protein
LRPCRTRAEQAEPRIGNESAATAHGLCKASSCFRSECCRKSAESRFQGQSACRQAAIGARGFDRENAADAELADHQVNRCLSRPAGFAGGRRKGGCAGPRMGYPKLAKEKRLLDCRSLSLCPPAVSAGDRPLLLGKKLGRRHRRLRSYRVIKRACTAVPRRRRLEASIGITTNAGDLRRVVVLSVSKVLESKWMSCCFAECR